jgi:hypothetical protein
MHSGLIGENSRDRNMSKYCSTVVGTTQESSLAPTPSGCDANHRRCTLNARQSNLNLIERTMLRMLAEMISGDAITAHIEN